MRLPSISRMAAYRNAVILCAITLSHVENKKFERLTSVVNESTSFTCERHSDSISTIIKYRGTNSGVQVNIAWVWWTNSTINVNRSWINKLTIERDIESDVIKIRLLKLKKSDSGKYSCTNQHSKVYENYRLIVMDAPGLKALMSRSKNGIICTTRQVSFYLLELKQTVKNILIREEKIDSRSMRNRVSLNINSSYNSRGTYTCTVRVYFQNAPIEDIKTIPFKDPFFINPPAAFNLTNNSTNEFSLSFYWFSHENVNFTWKYIEGKSVKKRKSGTVKNLDTVDEKVRFFNTTVDLEVFLIKFDIPLDIVQTVGFISLKIRDRFYRLMRNITVYGPKTNVTRSISSTHSTSQNTPPSSNPTPISTSLPTRTLSTTHEVPSNSTSPIPDESTKQTVEHTNERTQTTTLFTVSRSSPKMLSGEHRTRSIIIGVVVGVGVLVIAALIAILVYCRRSRKKESQPHPNKLNSERVMFSDLFHLETFDDPRLPEATGAENGSVGDYYNIGTTLSDKGTFGLSKKLGTHPSNNSNAYQNVTFSDESIGSDCNHHNNRPANEYSVTTHDNVYAGITENYNETLGNIKRNNEWNKRHDERYDYTEVKLDSECNYLVEVDSANNNKIQKQHLTQNNLPGTERSPEHLFKSEQNITSDDAYKFATKNYETENININNKKTLNDTEFLYKQAKTLPEDENSLQTTDDVYNRLDEYRDPGNSTLYPAMPSEKSYGSLYSLSNSDPKTHERESTQADQKQEDNEYNMLYSLKDTMDEPANRCQSDPVYNHANIGSPLRGEKSPSEEPRSLYSSTSQETADDAYNHLNI